MRLSLSNGIFSKYSLDENIAAVRRHGFENLEFNMKCLKEEDEESVYTAKKLIDAHGLNCLTLHAASLHVKDENEIAKAVYYGKISADFAHKLSAPVLVVHSNVSRRLARALNHVYTSGWLLPLTGRVYEFVCSRSRVCLRDVYEGLNEDPDRVLGSLNLHSARASI